MLISTHFPARLLLLQTFRGATIFPKIAALITPPRWTLNRFGRAFFSAVLGGEDDDEGRSAPARLGNSSTLNIERSGSLVTPIAFEA